jgi:hypothetical protein
MLERKTSEQRRPIASVRDTPVISSAARLNDVMRHIMSTVKTPSEMLSSIASVGVLTGGCLLCVSFVAMRLSTGFGFNPHIPRVRGACLQ